MKRGRNPSVVVYVNGEQFTLRQVSEEYCLPMTTVYQRYQDGCRGNDLIRPIRNNLSGIMERDLHNLWGGKWEWNIAQVTNKRAIELLTGGAR